MDTTTYINDFVANMAIDVAYAVNANTEVMGGVLFVLAGYALLDIFTGNNIHEGRLGMGLYIYLQKVPNILPTWVDIVLLIVFASFGFRVAGMPEVIGKQMYTNGEYDFEITVPKNWEITENADLSWLKRFGYNLVENQKELEGVLIELPVASLSPIDYVTVFSAVGFYSIPPKYELLEVDGFDGEVYYDTQGRGLIGSEMRVLALPSRVNEPVLVVAETDRVVINKMLESLKFSQ